MWFQTKETLSEDEIKQGLAYVIRDGMASQAMAVTTGGIFLVALAVELGASNFVVGLLAAIPPLLQLVQLPAILLIEKVRNRRLITVLSLVVSRMPWLLVALSPLLFPPEVGLSIILLALMLNAAFGGIAGCAWNSWMRDLVPENTMGAFFSKRMRIATGLGLALSLLAGIFIDAWKNQRPENAVGGYAVLFGIGFVAGVMGILFLAKVPEPRMKQVRVPLFSLFAGPFRDKNFRKLLFFMGAWSFAVNLAAPFFTVYMLDRLSLGMSLVVVLSVVSQIFNFAFLGVWGRFSDRFSNKSVLAVSGPLFMLCVLAWTFTTLPEKYFLTIPLLFAIHAVMGVAMAGVALASGNIGLKLAPRGEATAYLATNTIVNSLAAGISPILGGKFADFFASCNLSLTVNWSSPGQTLAFETLNFQHWDFFFGFAFLVGLYAMHRLSLIEEVGEVDDQVVRDEFISVVTKPVRSLSSVAGLFQVLSFPMTALKGMIRRED